LDNYYQSEKGNCLFSFATLAEEEIASLLFFFFRMLLATEVGG
jgi:hypothetical protein